MTGELTPEYGRQHSLASSTHSVSPVSSTRSFYAYVPRDENAVKVMTRVRPFNTREWEISEREGKELRSCIAMRDNVCAVLDLETGEEREAFTFDECFWSLPPEQEFSMKPFADQQYVYERSGLVALHSALEGYNTCIFAYGQTGSGKTHSMLGSREDPGISLRLVDELFETIAATSEKFPAKKTEIECTFMEVYNEKVRDLFNKKQKEGEYSPVKIRLHPQKGVIVEGLLRKPVETAAQGKMFLERGVMERAQAETKMNAHSSRSHAIFQMHVTQKDSVSGTIRMSLINLVDLAGSEKVKSSGATGDVLTEAKNINLSLSTLRKVIDVLIDNSKLKPNSKQRRIPPFRESVLTWVLSDSLGGNSKTMMLTAISPHSVNTEETLSTLRYALRAKAIVCSAKVNEEKSAALMQSMKDEIMRLQQQLQHGGGGNEGISLEVEERERILHELESDFKKKEEELQQQMQERIAEQNEMRVEIGARRHQAFAEAFRAIVSQRTIDHALHEAQALVVSKTKECENIEAERKRLTTKLAQYEEDSQKQARQLAQLGDQNRSLEKSYQETKRAFDEQSKRVLDLEQQCQVLQRKKNQSERNAEGLKENIRSLCSVLEKECAATAAGRVVRLPTGETAGELIESLLQQRMAIRRKREVIFSRLETHSETK